MKHLDKEQSGVGTAKYTSTKKLLLKYMESVGRGVRSAKPGANPVV